MMSDADHITTTSDERLVIMANQIARFFASQPGDAAVDGVARHIADFWDPRMRTRIRAHIDSGGGGLDPIAREAIEKLTSQGRTTDIIKRVASDDKSA